MRNRNRRICKVFSQNLKYYMDLHGMTRKDLEKKTGIEYSTICNWLNCYSYAGDDNIERLAREFGISKYELTEHNEKATNDITIDKENFKLRKEAIEKLSKLSNEELKHFIEGLDLYFKK